MEVVKELGEVVARTVPEATTKQKLFVLDSVTYFVCKLFSLVEPAGQHWNS